MQVVIWIEESGGSSGGVPEAIKVVLLDVPSKIRQQEAQRLPVVVVEQPTVPHGVATALSAVKVAVVRAVEHVEAVEHVLGRVAVHDVEQHQHAQAVRRVDQLLELLGRAEPTRDGVEARDLVAEAGVVRVLHDAHELDAVVAEVGDHRQHVARELEIRRDARLARRHAHVCLVDLEALVGAEHRPLVPPLVGLARRRIPVDRVEQRVAALLHDAPRPRRDAIHRRTACRAVDVHLRHESTLYQHHLYHQRTRMHERTLSLELCGMADAPSGRSGRKIDHTPKSPRSSGWLSLFQPSVPSNQPIASV